MSRLSSDAVLGRIFDPAIGRLDRRWVRSVTTADALLYRSGDVYIRVGFDERERLLSVYVGRGDGAPPRWDVRPENLCEFLVDTILEEAGLAGVDDDALQKDGAGLPGLELVARRYATVLPQIQHCLTLPPELLTRLRRRAVRDYNSRGRNSGAP